MAKNIEFQNVCVQRSHDWEHMRGHRKLQGNRIHELAVVIIAANAWTHLLGARLESNPLERYSWGLFAYRRASLLTVRLGAQSG